MGIKTQPRTARYIIEEDLKQHDSTKDNRLMTPADAGLEESCLNKLQVGDRFFTLICTDACAPSVIRYWCMLVREKGGSEAKWRGGLDFASELEAWQKENPERVKVPD